VPSLSSGFGPIPPWPPRAGQADPDQAENQASCRFGNPCSVP
jgi:hypothetical protein